MELKYSRTRYWWCVHNYSEPATDGAQKCSYLNYKRTTRNIERAGWRTIIFFAMLQRFSLYSLTRVNLQDRLCCNY